jgi:hypothetical protein
MRADDETQREVVRLVLERERTLDGLERLLSSEAVAAVKTLAADRVVVRHGERLWASPCLSRLEALGLIRIARPGSVGDAIAKLG